MQPKFTIEKLTYHYTGRTEAALENVNLMLPAGVATAILGLSASGKSTLLGILGRLIECRTKTGEVRLHSPAGRPLDYATLDRRASNELRLRRFGFVMQASLLLPNFSCRRNVLMPLTLQGLERREQDERLARLLDELRNVGEQSECQELEDALQQSPAEISGGQKQRLAVLRALIHDPEVVFADEPCNSLDPYNAGKFRSLLKAWHAAGEAVGKERTLILVTHNAQEAWEVASQFVLIETYGLGALQVEPRSAFDNAKQIEDRIVHSARRQLSLKRIPRLANASSSSELMS